MNYDLITILGPTACGKTTVAAHLAKRLDGEVISADSRQLYRGMTIGSGKDLKDYRITDTDPKTGEERVTEVPYHLIDIRDCGYRFNVYEFQCEFMKAYMDIKARGKMPILCGGTGLYIESVLKAYELGSVGIPQYHSLTIGLDISRELRRQRITERLYARMDEGMVDEVRSLLQKVTPERLIRYGLEYKYLTLYIIGELSYDEMLRQLEIAIHQFAKRQMTWFRGMEQRGTPITWIDATRPIEEKVEEIVRML